MAHLFSSAFSWRALSGIAALSANMLVAQDACDSVQIVSLTYAPFTDTALQVVVLNNSAELFSYPQFSLVNDQGDTLAREGVNFFGLGWGEQTHRMDLLPGETMPTTPFTGTLVLYYMFGIGNSVCTFPIITELCPPACEPLNVYLYPQFGSTTTSSFPWNVSDSTGAVVASGTLTINVDSLQQDWDTLCLLPGAYTLHVEQPIPSGTEFQFGLTQDVFTTNGPSDLLPTGGSTDLSFLYYPTCINGGMNVTHIVEDGEPTLILDGRRLTITKEDGHTLGLITVFDAVGRRLLVEQAHSSSAMLDLSGIAGGVHMVAIGGLRATFRIMLP